MILASSMGTADLSLTVDLGLGDDFRVSSDSVFAMICNFDVVHRR